MPLFRLAGVKAEMGFAKTLSINYIPYVRHMSFFRALMAALFVLAALCGGWTALAAQVVSRGDFTFYLDTATFRATGGRVLQEIYVRIPNNEITLNPSGEKFVGKVEVSVEIKDLQGKIVIQDSEKVEFSEDDEARTGNSLYFQTLIKRYMMDPGVYQLSYGLVDEETPKRSVLGIMKGQFNKSAIRNVRIEVPEIPENAASFSQPEFVWSIDSVDGNTVYHPNPPRMYGLYKDTLIVYVELYLPDETASAPTFEFRSYVLDPDGNAVADRTVSLPNPKPAEHGVGLRTYPIVIREDLTTFVAGAYSLNFTFSLDNQILSRVRAGRFSVAWDLRTWEVPRREYLAESRFLLGDKEFAAFENMGIGEQERMLDELWRAEDPSPETGINEAYEEFLNRLEYVNLAFAEHTKAAIFTDRGQIYMKWGPPDEFIEDVIPVNRETISEAFAVVEEKYHAFNYSTHGVKRYTNSIRPPVIDHRRMSQVGEGGNTAFPFELWIYNDAGDPILKRHREQDPDIGMRYLFVDREGYGVYRLETSSKISDK
jgi:GWxTD domain-containing protein